MLRTWLKRLRSLWPPIILLVTGLVLFFTNYKPGTFLVGWDNLYPELNFALAFKRNFFAIWQEYRGLGLIDGMSHAANLPHTIIRFIFSLFLPVYLIRWLYIFGMHFLGGLGVYYLTSYLLSNKKLEARRYFLNFTALLAALFYQYNFATIQQFFLPFEVFVTHFAWLPWLVFLVLKYLKSGKRRHLFLFFLASVLSTTQAHVPTLFITYLLALLIIFIGQFMIAGNSRKRVFKRFIVICLFVFGANAFWGLPFAYSTLTNSQVIANSKNFQMASNDIFYRNHKYGRLQDVALFKGISLDYKYFDFKTGKSHLMLHPWLDHLSRPLFYVPAWIFFSLAVLGLISVFSKKRKAFLGLGLVFLVAFSFMGTDIPFIGLVSQFLRQRIPLFSTVFRFTFTKFSILYCFSYALLFGLGVYQVLSWLKRKFLQLVFLSLLFLGLALYALPAFQRHFFYENLAVSIPKPYFQAFDFFESQDHQTRVAILPQPWYWSWTQNKWGTISSGFIWYGIPQPTADLAFISWGRANENFYWEMEQAVYTQNPQFLKEVLDKYDIGWIYFDKSVDISPAPNLPYQKYESLFARTRGVDLADKFDFIQIYKVVDGASEIDFVEFKPNLPIISPEYSYDNLDFAYQEYGDYISSQELRIGDNTIYYPFRSLFSGKDFKDIEFQLKEEGEKIIFSTKLPSELRSHYLTFGPLDKKEFRIWNRSDLSEEKYFIPQVYLDNELLVQEEDLELLNNLSLQLPEFEEGNFSLRFSKKNLMEYDNLKDPHYFRQKNDACEKNPEGQADLEIIKKDGQNILRLTSVGSDNCIKVSLPELEQQFAYLINIKANNLTPNRGLHFNIFNKTINKSDLDTYFDNDGKVHNYYLVMHPRQKDGLGYDLYFNNISEGREEVVNELEKVIVYKIPYNFLKQIKVSSAEVGFSSLDSAFPSHTFQISHPNPSFYKITVGKEQLANNKTLVLSQSFHPGWFAYLDKPFFGQRISEHVMVNNWANGWQLDQSELGKESSASITIYLFFLPQLLQYLGLSLLVLSLLYLSIASLKGKPE